MFSAPAYFSIFLRAIKPFVDPVTYGKIVIIKGDYSPGSKNDEKMQLLIGPGWREKCGVDAPRQDKKSSPGYVHKTYWPALLAEEKAFFEKKKGTVLENKIVLDPAASDSGTAGESKS